MSGTGNQSGVIPSLLAKDLDETVKFYRVLGFSVTGRYPEAGPPTWVEATRGDAVLQFYADPPQGTPESPMCSGTFYLGVSDVAALATQLRSEGVVLEWGPEVMDYGQLEFGVRDPNGYLLAFSEPAN